MATWKVSSWAVQQASLTADAMIMIINGGEGVSKNYINYRCRRYSLACNLQEGGAEGDDVRDQQAWEYWLINMDWLKNCRYGYVDRARYTKSLSCLKCRTPFLPVHLSLHPPYGHHPRRTASNRFFEKTHAAHVCTPPP